MRLFNCNWKYIRPSQLPRMLVFSVRKILDRIEHLPKIRVKNDINLKTIEITLPKTPTNGWLEYYFPIGEAYFQGLKR